VENGCDTGYFARAIAGTGAGYLSAYTWLGLADFWTLQPPPAWCIGFAAAVADPKMEFDSESDWTASVDFSASTAFVFEVGGTAQRGMLFGVVTVDDTPQPPMLVVMTPNGYGNQGCTLDVTTIDDFYIYDWTRQMTIGGAAGQHTVSANIQFAQDDGLDVDADGRFADSDVGALADIVGTGAATDPDNVARWDFDGDGTIDDDDVALMLMFVDAGAGAGLFADANGDGVIDCGDYATASPYPLGAIISDPDYITALDENLDGLLDQSDLDAFLAARGPDANGEYLCCPGDIDHNGIVDIFDFGILAAHWGMTVPIGTGGDVNYDGFVDIFDQGIFAGNFSCTSN
jgi:hypothetical protein